MTNGAPDLKRATAGDHATASLPTLGRYPVWKRLLDLSVGSVAALAAIPVLLGIRLAMIVSGDTEPFLYRASRIGEDGRSITVLKVRTMRLGEPGPMITAGDDPRITSLGRILRRSKLDELPQLWNVLVGDMGLVGPRPEDPTYVDFADPLHRLVFNQRPGITGPSQLAFRNEAALLAGVDADRVYRDTILPAKLAMDVQYLTNRSLRRDLAILARTAATVLGRRDQ